MICVVSDTHRDIGIFAHKKIRSLKKGDTLVILGDFGFLWEDSPKEHQILKKIGARHHTTLFVTGYHDNEKLFEQFEEVDCFGGRGRHISGELYMLCGGIYEIEGKKLFISGSPAEDEQEALTDRLSDELLNNNMEVDAVMTHEPPSSVGEFLTGEKDIGILGAFFDEMKTKLKFKMWYFGKLHKNKVIPPKYTAVYDEPSEVQ